MNRDNDLILTVKYPSSVGSSSLVSSSSLVGSSSAASSSDGFQAALGNAMTFAKSQNGMTLLGCLAAVLILQVFGSGKKGKIATSRWAGKSEISSAGRKAKKQIAKPTRNSVALYVGQPEFMDEKLKEMWRDAGLLRDKPPNRIQQTAARIGKIGSTERSFYLPDVQRGVSVIGAAGCGKTFTVIDPLIRSTLDQGFPLLLYDFKYPAQCKRAVAYAIKRGYTVRVFAPGRPESETCNPLDLIRDEEDAVAAGQLAQVIGKNFNSGGGSGDKFFEEAGDSLVEGLLLVTKAVATLTGKKEYCDLMMAQAILSLSNLAGRMDEASKTKLKVWTTRPLSQLISVKDSEKTVSGIVGTAQRMFMRFLKKDFIGAFCGETSLPLDLEGKQMIVFGLDRNNRDIVGPLLAAILHMVVTRNVSRTVPRKDCLVVALDELPTLYLPALVNWLNENREDGFVGILGYQNMAQLEKFYGKDLARAIIGGTAHKIIFNPQDPESAKVFADYLGEEEISFRSKSTSTGKSGNSTSYGEQTNKKYLLEPAQFLKLGVGRAVVINPGYTEGGPSKEAYVPSIQSIKVPQADIKEMNWAESKWDAIRNTLLEQNSRPVSDEERRQQFEERRNLAEELFPEPVDSGAKEPSVLF
ncbi:MULTISPECIES: type IV secretion system DNA-binding domain-containing protein [unclassified Microcoleus]|uniref:type IV secretory system conjugative DNA transfer family protein n=1 Tax=unclassified Microcoleus TaxID=2642155 RepID=UPI0025DB6D2D|nr:MULTISPECIES: type IV secretion system DNA-binding domain-containing protein [unclassified Microcoleus]